MQLSLKAVRFVIDALDHYRNFHDDQLRQPGLSEDDIADLENDRLFLDAIKSDFEKYKAELNEQRKSVNAEV